jgi:hypothetical protein
MINEKNVLVHLLVALKTFNFIMDDFTVHMIMIYNNVVLHASSYSH